ncbi:hypothetical protein [Maritalea porphyrae]|jgi:hypothetical protein|uniref:hypothetical protein n=1 Tax=Maritalea porphyrae TaxID=880732 RepID=UPI0022AE995D|nr:hypothetical protein [Maritalea porphyrae]MCZ4271772.1 hypothetical protein [Maritalea porphyrae]
MTKILISTFATLVTTSAAFAHAGHTAVVDGHAHTIADLVLMGAAPVALGLAAIALVLYARGRKS